jgi:CubicO group peptidase (beta-lactamase class C family)
MIARRATLVPMRNCGLPPPRVPSESHTKSGHSTAGAVSHVRALGGAGGSLLCVDPARELVVVWLSVWPDADMRTTSQYVFVDALVESVVD